MKQLVSMPSSVAKQSSFKMWLNQENKLFSYFLEESINNVNVLRVTHAFIAFTFLISSSFSNPLVSLGCLFWFIMTLYLCRKGGLK